MSQAIEEILFRQLLYLAGQWSNLIASASNKAVDLGMLFNVGGAVQLGERVDFVHVVDIPILVIFY